MASLIHKIVWEDKDGPDDEGNTLIVRIEDTRSAGKALPKKRTGRIEIVSPAEDEYGRPYKKRLRIDGALLAELRDATRAFEGVLDERGGFKLDTTSDGATIQVRFEGTSPLVVMFEVPPFTTPAEMKPRYVIGNGEDIRFVFASLKNLRGFCAKLETAGVV